MGRSRSAPTKSAKSANVPERAVSPSDIERAVEEVDPVDPAVNDGKPKKKRAPRPRAPRPKKDKDKVEVDAADDADADANADEAAPPKKKRRRSKKDAEATTTPVDIMADNDGDNDGDGNGEDTSFVLTDILDAVKMFRSIHKRKPTAAELAEATEMDEATARKALKAYDSHANRLSNQKATARVKGYRKLAKAAGYAYSSEIISCVDKGEDSLNSLLSMSDALRLATFMPSTPAAMTFYPDEFAARSELMGTTLPEGPAREVVANAECVFKHMMNEATKVSILSKGTQSIAPSTMIQVLKPFVERMQFSSIEAGPGLVKYAKDESPPDRADFAASEQRAPNGARSNPVFDKAVLDYKKRVPFADRGIAIKELTFDVDDADAKKVVGENKKMVNKNLKLFNEKQVAIDADRVAKAARRTQLKAAA